MNNQLSSTVLGAGTLPGPISELHVTEITDSSLELDWESPSDGSNVTDYVVYYQKVDNTSMHETVSKLEHVSWSNQADGHCMYRCFALISVPILNNFSKLT